MQKIDYQHQLDDILKTIPEQNKTNGRKQTLLLHACCAPCSSYVIEYLSQYFAITIFYYNPNIHPQAEYERRLAELKKFLTQFPLAVQNEVRLVVADYDPEDYFIATNVRLKIELQTEPEKGERCRRCYEFRMKKAWQYACEHSFDWFTTTLSISPHKDADKINTIGKELERVQPEEMKNNTQTNDSFLSDGNTKYLPANFKKKGGFLRSTQLSAEYGLWRQDYCGCVYSQRMREGV
ncbi:MAG: epoxyqueuosine reductase QueH [Treponema sp.]|nr:epoxyqueuosine reductase QueH [Treponema sp.]